MQRMGARDMQRGPSFLGVLPARFAIPILATAAAILLAFALPATASASQALTVETNGTGTGKVVSSPTGIECPSKCSTTFNDNAVVTLTGSPGANTQAAQWSGCDKVITGNKCEVTMSAAKAVIATFNLVKRQLTVKKGGSGTGTVTSTPAGVDCGLTCSASFDHGTAVTLSGVSGPNTQAVSWLGCTSVNVENKCLVTMSAAKSVTATFNLEKHQLSVTKGGSVPGTVTSSPSGINCGASCTASFNHGVTVTLTGTPSGIGQGVQWSGCDSINAEHKCVVAMNAARAVTATFNPVYQLTVSSAGSGTGTVTSSPAGIECGSTCAAGFAEGSTVTLSGTPDPGIEPAKWIGCDSVNLEGKCLVAMSSAREVTAIFNLPSFTLTVVKIGNGIGTVTSSPTGIECPSACAEGFVKGSKVTLTGTPGLHTEAVKWAGCDEIKEGKCIVTMSAAREVTALFSLEPQYVEYTVSLNPKGTGTGSVVSFPPGISCPGDCSEKYLFKTPVTLIATANSGSAFAHWSGGSCSGSGPCERKINSDRTVNAVFTAVGNRTLTVAKAGSGQGVVTSKPQAIECGSSCSTELDAATKVSLHAVATPGSTFAGWSGEGCSGTGPCKVLMNEARNVTATFSKNPTPPVAKCRVPKLKGKTLAKARRALFAAHCSLGKAKKPKGKGKLVVASSRPGAGTVRPAGARVSLKLARKR